MTNIQWVCLGGDSLEPLSLPSNPHCKIPHNKQIKPKTPFTYLTTLKILLGLVTNETVITKPANQYNE